MLCFLSTRENQQELQECQRGRGRLGDAGQRRPPHSENICYCDGKLGIPNNDHQPKGLNPGYKKCGGKMNFLQQRTKRTLQPRGMIS